MDLSSSLARLEAEGQARWEDEIKTNKDVITFPMMSDSFFYQNKIWR